MLKFAEQNYLVKVNDEVNDDITRAIVNNLYQVLNLVLAKTSLSTDG